MMQTNGMNRKIIVLEMNGSGPDIIFDCPACGTSHGIHTQKVNKQNQRWKWNGSVQAPTFSPAIITEGKDGTCHATIKDGKIKFGKESTHKLSGKTIALADID